MSHVHPSTTSSRTIAEEEEKPTLVTNNGVQVFVREIPPWPSPRPPAEAPRPFPDAIIIPPSLSTEDRDAFLASVDAQWGAFIRKELAGRKDVAEESAKDLHQAVRIVLCRHYDKQRQAGQPVVPDNVPAFLKAVVDHAVCNHVHKKARRPRIHDGAEIDEAPDGALDPEEAALRAELHAKLERYRAGLSPEEAEVLDAREMRDLSFQEIGDALGLDKSTVFNIHKRAVQKLRDLARASERDTKLARRRGAGPVDS